MNMDEIKKYELDKSWQSMRYFLDFRLKFFNFFIASNGVLLTVVLAHLENNSSRIVLSLFSIAVSIIMTFIDKRIIHLAHMYRGAVISLTSELGLENLNNLQVGDSSKISLYHLFTVLYVLIILLWVSLIILIKYKLFII